MPAPRSDIGGGKDESTKLRFLFTLIIWLFVGPFGMLLTLMSIVQRGTGWTTGHDALFFALMFAALGARWIDHANGDPVISAGAAAKPGAARRYTIAVLAIGTVLWVIANAIGNHVLK